VPIDKHKPPTAIEAPVPQHVHEALQACGWSGASEYVDEMPLAIEQHTGEQPVGMVMHD
jgi:hypothetical protein